MSILRFYGRLLAKTPEAFRGSWDVVFWVVASVLVVATALNRQLGKELSDVWDGISPWWTLAIVAIVAVGRVAINNYEEFTALEKRVVTDEQARAKRRRIREGLTNLIAEAKCYETDCLERANASAVSQQVEIFSRNAKVFLRNELDGDESFLNLFLAATEHDYQPTEADMELMMFEDGDSNYQGWFRTLRAQRIILEKCYKEYPQL